MVKTEEEKRLSKTASQHKYYLKRDTFFKDEQKKRYNKAKTTLNELIAFKARHEGVEPPPREPVREAPVREAPPEANEEIMDENVQEDDLIALPERFRPGYSKASANTARNALALRKNYYPKKADGTPQLLFQPCYDLIFDPEVGGKCLNGTKSKGNMSIVLQNIRSVWRQGLGKGKEGDSWMNVDLWPVLQDIKGTFRKIILGMKTLEGTDYANSTYKGFIISISNMILILHVPLSEKQKLDLQILWFNVTVRAELTKYAEKHSGSNRSILDYSVFLERAKVLSKKEKEPVYYVIASMFNEVVFRRELINIILVSGNDKTQDKTKNYLILPTTRNSLAEYEMNNYKTFGKYGVNRGFFSAGTTATIREYVGIKNILYDKKMFRDCEGDLRTLITKIDAKKFDIAGSEGTFNFMRHSIISTAAAGAATNWDKLLRLCHVISTAKHQSGTAILDYVYRVHKK